ncbi:unnamed protein product [Rangifer tarandus platyrhynchus]|uniref:Uncharacterized protein n=2 Tax=Rangifer tarandus platyrhynchus TaxID=3082113 RepID=A0AC59YET4_RANTA|nr:unnamed protein product [Rangifer tarandus platyrhynchus]
MGPRAPRPYLKLRCTQAVFGDTLRLPRTLHPAVPRVFCLSGHGDESLRTVDGAGTVCVASPGKIRATLPVLKFNCCCSWTAKIAFLELGWRSCLKGGGKQVFSRVLWYALAAAAPEQREMALLHCAMKNMSYLNNCTHFIVIWCFNYDFNLQEFTLQEFFSGMN